MLAFFHELISFAAHRKRYWLFPVLFALVMLASFVFFTQGSAIMPVIYTLF